MTPSCTIGASLLSVTLGNSSLLTWSSTKAVSGSLTGAGAVAVAGSENVTPNTTSAYTLTVTSSTGATATCNVTVSVIGSGDTTPPTVSLTAPSSGATVSGSAITLTATASDNVAVADVQFKAGTTNIGSAILSSPYTTTWNTTVGTSTPDGTYTLYAIAADTSGNLATSSISVTVRNAPPVISAIATSSSYTSATTTWTTDEAANSKVVYGLTTGYGTASSSLSLVTSHSIILSGLTASSTYHFAVVSADAGGNTSTSTDQTFTTLATSTPPVISAISSGTPTTTAATIIWTTDQSANSEVVWGTTTAYGTASSSASFLTSHSIILSGLATSTLYHYAVVSANTFGATATSTDQTFTTASPAPDTTPPTIPTNLVATVASSSQINLSWTASTDNGGGDVCCSYKVYRDGTQIATSSITSYSDTGLQAATLHSYWIAAVDTAGNVSTSTGGTVAQTSYGTDQFGTTWKPLRIGAGGFITGIDIATNGTKVIRTDTYGAYLWDGGQWDQLISTSSMPAAFVNTQLNGGVYEIQIAPGNTNRFYMEYQGYALRSDNRGITWMQTAFPKTTDASNGTYRTNGSRIAIDPVNSNVVVVGTSRNGVYMSSDAGATWTHITAVGTSTADGGGNYYGNAVAFDPSSPVSGGKTQGIYVMTPGTGVYHSTDGGATWTLTSGTPTAFARMVVAQDGTVYLVDGSTTNLHVYSAGTWSSVAVGETPTAVAVDPSNVNRVVVIDGAGNLNVSTNHAVSFSGVTSGKTFTATDNIPWLSWWASGGAGGYMATADIVFDPTVSNTLYQSAGAGVWAASPSGSSVAWSSQSLGIEQLVANTVISPPGGQPLVAVWDQGIFRINNPDTFPSSHGVEPKFAAGWDVAYAPNNPNYIVAIANWFGTETSGYSNDGGVSWQGFATDTPTTAGGNISGSIAVASSTSIIWIPTDNGGNTVEPYYTTDGGATWHGVAIAGVPTTGETGWDFAYYLDRHIVTADTVNIGTYYAYNYGPSGAPSAVGVYKSTDGGATWTHVYSSALAGGFNVKLKAVPGKAGELFFTGGPVGSDSINSPANEPFEESTNGGTTWNAVTNVEEVYDFGFGQAKTGTTTPAIYIAGWVSNQYGIWESDDNANTWTQIGLWPLGSLDTVKAVSGDMNAYGRVYVGFNGSGYIYGNTTGARIPPIFSSISSNPALGASPPTTPTGLTATATSSVEIDLSWSSSTTTATTTGETITWTTNEAANSQVAYGTTTNYGLASSSASLVTSHSINLGGLSASTTYQYQIVSTDALGNTATSTDQSFTTGTIALAGYKIYRNGSQIATTTTITSYANTGLTPSTNYTYNVAAYDTAGNVSAQSSSATATTSNQTYTGPGDVNGTSYAFWSTRCMSNAYNGNVADIWDAATGNTTETLLTCSTGGVLNQTINPLSTACASGCKVKTLYDQSGSSKCSGSACNLTQTATTTRPTFTTNCQNGKSCLVFNGSACLATASTPTTQTQPYTISAVWDTTAAAANAAVFAAYNVVIVWTGGSGGLGNAIALNAGNDATVSANDNAIHAGQFLGNGAVSSIYIDGTANTGLNASTNSIATGPMSLGQFETCGGTFPWTGKWFETGIWAADKTTNNSTMNTNQHTYWVF